MKIEEAEVIEAAVLAARYLPPGCFLPDSAGQKACLALVKAVRRLRAAEKAKETAP